MLQMPCDGKTRCRVQNGDGDILELTRASGSTFHVTSLRPAGEVEDVSDDDVVDRIKEFCAN